MKRLLNFTLVASLLMLMGCVKEIGQEMNSVEESMRFSTLTAGFADTQTKTFVEDGLYLRWHADDRISAFFGNTLNRQYKFEGEDGDNSGSFSYVSSGMLETGNDIDRIYAVYPYDKGVKFVEGGKINLSLPSVQQYAVNSFGRGANTMVAVTASVEDTFLPFKNVCGYLKLKLKGEATVKSIEISGNSGEKISGKAVVAPVKGMAPELTMAEDASDCVVLDCGDGVELSADEEKEFWFALPETVFENGISVVVETTTGTRYAKCTKNKIPIVRNQIQPMAALNVPEDFHAEGLNVLEYTAPAKVELPASGSVFNSVVVGHKYDPVTQKGMIICDKPITTIGYATLRRSKLRNVTLPESVREIKDEAFSWCEDLSGVYYKSATPPSIGLQTFWCNGKRMPLIHYVPSNVLDEYKLKGYGLYCPYDYEKGYPAIPDDEIWYFSTKECSYDNSKFSYVSVESSEYNRNEAFGKLKFSGPVRYISNMAFNYSDFEAVILPGKVESMDNSFYGAETKLVVLPESLRSVTMPFFECVSLQEMVGKCVSADGRCLIVNNGLYDFAGYGMEGAEYTIPYGVTYIGMRGMSGTGLAKLNIPNTVTSLGQCSLASNRFDELVIPDSVTDISIEAFVHSTFGSVILGNSVKSIGWQAFSGCSITSLYCKSITPPAANKYVYSDWALFGESTYMPDGTTIYVPVGSGPSYKVHEDWGKYSKIISEYEF